MLLVCNKHGTLAHLILMLSLDRSNFMYYTFCQLLPVISGFNRFFPLSWQKYFLPWQKTNPASSPPRGEWSALTSVTHRDDAVNSSPQKPPATYMRVNDFGPHTDSIFRGRLIREYIRYTSNETRAWFRGSFMPPGQKTVLAGSTTPVSSLQQ